MGRVLLACTIACSLSTFAAAQFSKPASAEPIGAKKPVVRTMHGDSFVDDYFWYREKENPNLLAHLRKENAYADSTMRSTKPLQDRLYKEFVGRIKETDLDVPVYDRGYWYYSRTMKGAQYPVYCRKKGSMSSREETLLDLNGLAKGKSYLGLGGMEVSPNGKLLAFSIDLNGHRDYTLYFKDLDKSRLLKETFGVVSGFEWALDSRTLMFTTENAAKRTNKCWRRELGSKDRVLIYEETDPIFDLGISSSLDRRTLFVHSESKDSSESRFIDLDSPSMPPKLISRRRDGVRYYPSSHRGALYIRTNDRAREFKVVRTSFETPEAKNWRTFIPERSNTSIDDIDCFGDFVVVSVVQNAGRRLETYDLKSGATNRISFPETNYTASLGANRDPEANSIRLRYTSMITPSMVMETNLATRKSKVLKRQTVNGYDSKRYVTEQVWITARDGVRVPISLAYKRGTKKSRSTPLHLDAYGAYGSASFPSFDSNLVSLMDRGFMLGIAHIRGGGDLGENWYYNGKLSKKINTFNDFIDCVDALVEKGYTSRNRTIITGGSAGGLTMGAVLNFRPDVCGAALVYVPFVDVINTMSDETIPLTTQEFIEWGNPKIPAQYTWLKQYSPYENVKAQPYPAMLVRTSLNDSQVPYWEAAKWVSRLRALRTNKQPLLFKTNMDAGHGGASGRYDAFRDYAFDYAFALTALAIRK